MPEPISLTAPEAACLEALRHGAERTAQIACRAGLGLRRTERAVAMLASLGLAVINDRRSWRLTPFGQTALVSVAPTGRTRGRQPGVRSAPGVAATRVLGLLDRPRRGAELMNLLGVTRQRVHQLVVELSTFGLIRSADPTYPTFVVAQKDDPSILLPQDQERVLSALPDTEATTLSKIAVAIHMPSRKLPPIALSLREAGLIEKTETAMGGELYRLTAAGSAHWQRSATADRANIPPLPFRSDRVRAVLACLDSQGPIRTRDVGRGLGISPTSINALMQYLKRKNTVRTQTSERHAPYELTPGGRQMLAAMQGQAGGARATR